MERLALEATQEQLCSNVEFHDFINDSNFEQFINLIRGEHEDPITCFRPSYDGDELMFSEGMVLDNQFAPTLGDLLDFNSTSTSYPNSLLNSLAPVSEDAEEEDEGNNGGNSSRTTTTTPTNGMTVDRSKTLVSERRRRGRMKERLYELRSLVPNITKMDKASIIGDAMLYVQEMQMQAKKLRAEIVELESSLKGGAKTSHGLADYPKNNNYKHSICKKIVQMDVFQLEQRSFHIRLACNKGEGVAVSLYKAIESLTYFEVRSSNFAMVSESFILNCTVNVRECGEEMSLSTLKLWVTGALLNQGFELRTPIVP